MNMLVSSAAVAVTAGAAVALPTAPAAVLSLSAMIERHRAAYIAFNDICGFEDRVEESDPRFEALSAEWHRCNDVEEAALDELCTFRPKTMQEVHERADYLAVLLKRYEMSPEQDMALIDSYRS